MQYALVKPLLKQSHLDPQNLASYRPVANLTFLSKVAERVVSIRLQKYLNENGLQDSFQSAYREMHSVETALLRVQNDILTEMDKGNVVGLILLDLSGAFDTVDHSFSWGQTPTHWHWRKSPTVVYILPFPSIPGSLCTKFYLESYKPEFLSPSRFGARSPTV